VTRKSRREIERFLNDADGEIQECDLGRPLTDHERAALGDRADAWNETRQRRRVFRALNEAAREAQS